MQKLIVLSVFIFIVLLVSLNFYLESRYYVCPNGNLVDFDFQCEKYNPEKISIINTPNFFETSFAEVKNQKIISNGTIKISIPFPKENEVSFEFYPFRFTSANEYDFSPEEAFFSNRDGTYYLYKDKSERAIVTPTYVNKLEFNLQAPKIPGTYRFYALDYKTKPTYFFQNLTVIGPTNETLAYAIADRQLYIPIKDIVYKDWKTLSKSSSDKGTFFEIFMENQFQSCDTDQRAPICESKTVSGKFLISKETGQIIG